MERTHSIKTSRGVRQYTLPQVLVRAISRGTYDSVQTGEHGHQRHQFLQCLFTSFQFIHRRRTTVATDGPGVVRRSRRSRCSCRSCTVAASVHATTGGCSFGIPCLVWISRCTGGMSWTFLAFLATASPGRPFHPRVFAVPPFQNPIATGKHPVLGLLPRPRAPVAAAAVVAALHRVARGRGTHSAALLLLLLVHFDGVSVHHGPSPIAHHGTQRTQRQHDPGATAPTFRKRLHDGVHHRDDNVFRDPATLRQGDVGEGTGRFALLATLQRGSFALFRSHVAQQPRLQQQLDLPFVGTDGAGDRVDGAFSNHDEFAQAWKLESLAGRGGGTDTSAFGAVEGVEGGVHGLAGGDPQGLDGMAQALRRVQVGGGAAGNECLSLFGIEFAVEEGSGQGVDGHEGGWGWWGLGVYWERCDDDSLLQFKKVVAIFSLPANLKPTKIGIELSECIVL